MNLDDIKQPTAQLADLILDIDHISIAVESLDAAIQWYEMTLGFTLVERRVTSGEHSGMLSAVMRAGRAIVVLVQGTCPRSQISLLLDKSGPGVSHIAYAVADMDEAVMRITAAGGQFDTPILCGEGIRQIFLQRDPVTGVRIELIERTGGSLSDKNIERLFRTLEEKGLY